MVLDECLPHDASHAVVEQSIELTTRWARRCKEAAAGNSISSCLGLCRAEFMGIFAWKRAANHGAEFRRIRSRRFGCWRNSRRHVAMTETATALLPEDRPRYFMGGARPEQIVQLVRRGVDMFDCVIPTRNAATANFSSGRQTIFLARFMKRSISRMQNLQRIFPNSIPMCLYDLRDVFRAYLHHLYDVQEPSTSASPHS